MTGPPLLLSLANDPFRHYRNSLFSSAGILIKCCRGRCVAVHGRNLLSTKPTDTVFTGAAGFFSQGRMFALLVGLFIRNSNGICRSFPPDLLRNFEHVTWLHNLCSTLPSNENIGRMTVTTSSFIAKYMWNVPPIFDKWLTSRDPDFFVDLALKLLVLCGVCVLLGGADSCGCYQGCFYDTALECARCCSHGVKRSSPWEPPDKPEETAPALPAEKETVPVSNCTSCILRCLVSQDRARCSQCCGGDLLKTDWRTELANGERRRTLLSTLIGLLASSPRDYDDV